jgi:hypothetical protein
VIIVAKFTERIAAAFDKSGEIRAKAEAKITDIEAKIKTLESMKKTLRKLTKSCGGCGPVAECPILESLEGNG